MWADGVKERIAPCDNLINHCAGKIPADGFEAGFAVLQCLPEFRIRGDACQLLQFLGLTAERRQLLEERFPRCLSPAKEAKMPPKHKKLRIIKAFSIWPRTARRQRYSLRWNDGPPCARISRTGTSRWYVITDTTAMSPGEKAEARNDDAVPCILDA